MIKDIDYYRSIHNATGCKTHKEMEVKTIHKRLSRDFEKTLDTVEFSDFFTNNVISLEIKKETKSDVSGYQREFTSLITAPVYHGDTLFDSESNTYWICTEVMCKSKLYYEGKLTRCNNFLKWQDDSGKIFEYPIFDINGTQYNSGTKGDKVLTLASSQHIITIIADENTIVLDHDKRFFHDRNTKSPTVFKLTQNDTTALNYDKGLLHITVTEDEFNPDTDSIENWLCDYFKPEIPTTKDIEITFNGEPIIRSGGSAKTFKADNAYSVNLWELELLSIQKDFVSLSYEGNTCKVRCKQNDNLVGTKFTLKCQDNDGHFGQVVIKIGSGV